MVAIETGVSMTVSQYLKSDAPVHLAQIRCWRLYRSNSWKLRLCRYTFYLDRVEFHEHPWGEKGKGAAFEREWAIEHAEADHEGFRASGRSGPGWDVLQKSFETLGWFEYEAAEDAFKVLARKHEEAYFYHYGECQRLLEARSKARADGELWRRHLLQGA